MQRGRRGRPAERHIGHVPLRAVGLPLRRLRHTGEQQAQTKPRTSVTPALSKQEPRHGIKHLARVSPLSSGVEERKGGGGIPIQFVTNHYVSTLRTRFDELSPLHPYANFRFFMILMTEPAEALPPTSTPSNHAPPLPSLRVGVSSLAGRKGKAKAFAFIRLPQLASNLARLAERLPLCRRGFPLPPCDRETQAMGGDRALQ